MIATHAFKATSIENVKEKINTLKALYPDIKQIQYQCHHKGDLRFSTYDEEKFLNEFSFRRSNKFFTDDGHFTLTFTQGSVSIQDYATNKVQWEE